MPLDAVQIASYGHALGIFPARVNIPRPQPGHGLSLDEASIVQGVGACHVEVVALPGLSPAEASTVERACADLVLDAPWSAVVSGLRIVQQQERAGTVGHWLCGQALKYIEPHIHPPYEGPKTILDWLGQRDTPDLRPHLRLLVKKMGEVLEGSASKPGAITFAKDKSGEPDILTGTISAVYVRLHQGGEPIERQWIEKKEQKKARLNLWFDSRYGAAQRVGMDFWVEATGAQQSPHYLKVAADTRPAVKSWNEASERQKGYAEQFESRFEEWCKTAGRGQVGVYAVRFKGKNKIWQGGGDYAGDAPNLPLATPKEALDFLRKNRAELWRFPRVGRAAECKTIDQAQPLVRKPAVALWVPLNVQKLEECGSDENKLQTELRKAVEQIANIASSQ